MKNQESNAIANLHLEDFFVKGFVTGEFFIDATSFLKYEFADCEDPNVRDCDSLPDAAKDDMLKLHQLVGEVYVSQIFPNYKLMNCGMWEGVDSGSCTWHNDCVDGSTMNTNLLVYLDDTTEHGNSIEIRNGLSEYCVLPKANEFVWLNQAYHFQHKATHNTGRRRILSFEFLVDGINT